MMQYKASELSIISLKAKNDINGNPRRLYLLLHKGDILQAIDEGYEGSSALRSLEVDKSCVLASCILGCEIIETTPKEYKRLLKKYGEYNQPNQFVKVEIVK